MSDFGFKDEIYKATRILRDQLAHWARETGDHPRKLTFSKEMFDRLCAETADLAIRNDQNVLSIVQSFVVPGPNGYVVVEREEQKKG